MLPRWSVGIFCNKSKNTCVDIQENISQKIAAIWTPHCGGKRDGCVLSAAKINLLFRNRAVFRRKCFGFSVRRNTLQKKLVDFSSKPLRFLAFSLSFFGKGSVSASATPSTVLSCASPRAFADTRLRIAHSASSKFLPSPFTFTPNSLYSCGLWVNIRLHLTLHR